MKKRMILFTAGGTGGHIFPALAVAKLLEDENEIIWVGGKVGLENEIIPKHGIKLETIKISGLRKKGLLKLALMPFLLLYACYQALKIIFHYKPDVIVGFGGYATFPICLAGALMRIPVLIHEQNAIPGLSNKILAKFASKVMVAFEGVLDSKCTHLVGNPIRNEMQKLAKTDERYKNRTGGLNVLILGGSLGAKIFNDTLPTVFASTKNIAHVTHQVGRGDIGQVLEDYKKHGVNAEVVSFIDDMAAVYADSDLVICRSGASTVSEIAVVGIATVFVPYPHAVDDHQRYNAMPLVEAGAAYMLLQKELTVNKLVDLIRGLDRQKCLSMANKCKDVALPNSSEEIYNIIQSYL